MKLKALSNYDGDKSTRFGDCILIYDLTSMIVYDCGHGKHAEYVESSARVPCNNVVCDKESRQESSQSHCSVSN